MCHALTHADEKKQRKEEKGTDENDFWFGSLEKRE